jgi:hypothetical protein
MTNQEAIKRIKEHIAIHKYRESHAIHIVEALEMAISALQAQELSNNSPKLDSGNGELATTCNDTISRQAAIDAIYDWWITVGDKRHPVDVIKALPPAQPEIIRCKECLMHCVCKFEQGLGLDGYCSQAKRRTDEAD